MFKPTHRAMATPPAVATALALYPHIGFAGAATIVITARGWGKIPGCSMLPDNMEKWVGFKLENHRTWSHWLLTCVLAGVVIGLLVYGAGYGLSELIRDRIPAHGQKHAHGLQVARSVYDMGVAMSILIGIGATIGTVMHSLADACTVGGVPLLGPFNKKKMWVVPKKYRTTVGQQVEAVDPMTGKTIKVRTRDLTRGERLWGMGANLATASILFIVLVLPDLLQHQKITI